MPDFKLNNFIDDAKMHQLSSLTSTIIYICIDKKLMSILTLDTSSSIREQTDQVVKFLKKEKNSKKHKKYSTALKY